MEVGERLIKREDQHFTGEEERGRRKWAQLQLADGWHMVVIVATSQIRQPKIDRCSMEEEEWGEDARREDGQTPEPRH